MGLVLAMVPVELERAAIDWRAVDPMIAQPAEASAEPHQDRQALAADLESSEAAAAATSSRMSIASDSKRTANIGEVSLV